MFRIIDLAILVFASISVILVPASFKGRHQKIMHASYWFGPISNIHIHCR